MNFTAPTLPFSFQFVAWGLLVAILLRAWRAPSVRALAQGGATLWLAATLAVWVLWQIRTGVKPGLSFHLYGIAVLTLMFGYWRAVVAGVLVLGLNAALGRGSFGVLGVDALLSVVVPAWISWQAMRQLEKRLPRHFFVYALGNGFFGAALSVVGLGLATTALLALAGVYPLRLLLANYTVYTVLMVSWAEAFLSGMVITLMAVYRPAWLVTFDEAAILREDREQDDPDDLDLR